MVVTWRYSSLAPFPGLPCPQSLHGCHLEVQLSSPIPRSSLPPEPAWLSLGATALYSPIPRTSLPPEPAWLSLDTEKCKLELMKAEREGDRKIESEGINSEIKTQYLLSHGEQLAHQLHTATLSRLKSTCGFLPRSKLILPTSSPVQTWE